jgi:hypothetical protein
MRCLHITADHSACNSWALLCTASILCTDGITMGEDLKGKDAAVRWFKSYFDRYDFASHDAIAAAADEGTRSSFSFYVDQVPLLTQPYLTGYCRSTP